MARKLKQTQQCLEQREKYRRMKELYNKAHPDRVGKRMKHASASKRKAHQRAKYREMRRLYGAR